MDKPELEHQKDKVVTELEFFGWMANQTPSAEVGPLLVEIGKKVGQLVIANNVDISGTGIFTYPLDRDSRISNTIKDAYTEFSI
jgi:hypothetical protein